MNEKKVFEDFLCSRNDEVDNLVHHCLKELLQIDSPDEFPWDMGIIGQVTDAIEDILADYHYLVCHPYYEGDMDEGIPCYKGTNCKRTDCPFKQNFKG